MRRWLREPALQFLLIGTGLFLAYGWLHGRASFSRDTIVITEGRIEQLAAGFAGLHRRPPTREELDGMVQDAVREEILYREAMALHLDADDVIVRRHLAQKLQFVSEDTHPVPEPTQAQLRDSSRSIRKSSRPSGATVSRRYSSIRSGTAVSCKRMRSVCWPRCDVRPRTWHW